jgi:hypothetical protein
MINPWDEKLKTCGMIEQLQILSGIAASISHTANTLLGLHGQICRLTDSIFLEANQDEALVSLAGFREGMETERRNDAEKDRRDSVAEHEKERAMSYIDKDTFLKLCVQIYDQKEVVIYDREA